MLHRCQRGGIFGRAETTFGFGEVSTNNSGFAGGGQIGCDYQFSGAWVVGIRNMFDGTSLHKDRTIAFGPLAGGEIDFKTCWFDTLTGRVGYAAAPAWLIYGQGGGAWAHSSSEVTFAGVQIGDFSKTRSGWTAGGGVEWMFAPRWSAFLEGNYMDFGSNDQTIRLCFLSGWLCLQRQDDRGYCPGRRELQIRVGQSALLRKTQFEAIASR